MAVRTAIWHIYDFRFDGMFGLVSDQLGVERIIWVDFYVLGLIHRNIALCLELVNSMSWWKSASLLCVNIYIHIYGSFKRIFEMNLRILHHDAHTMLGHINLLILRILHLEHGQSFDSLSMRHGKCIREMQMRPPVTSLHGFNQPGLFTWILDRMRKD